MTDDARLEGVVWFSFFVVVGERNDDDGLNVDEDEELLVLYPAVGEKETWRSPSTSSSSFRFFSGVGDLERLAVACFYLFD